MFNQARSLSLKEGPQLAPKADLPSLPVDLIGAIWQHLELRDRVALTSCCRRLRELNTCEILWSDLTIPVPGHSDDPAAMSSAIAQARDKFSVKLWGFLHACHRALGPKAGLISRAGLWLDSGMRRQQGAAAAAHASLAAWLRSHLAGLRQLRLDFDPQTHMDGRQVQRWPGQVVYFMAPVELTAALSTAPLEALVLTNSPALYGDAAPVLAPLRCLSPSLTRLCITNCQLRSLAAVGEGLGPAGRLLDLGLSGNNLSEGGDDAFAALTALTQLTRLDISANCLEALPQQLSALQQLAELEVSSNGLLGGEHSPAAFAPLASLGGSLRRLDLGCCGLGRLPQELSCLSRLRALGLGYCTGLAAAGTAAWEPLASLESLSRLSLRACDLTRLPSQLEQLSQLQHLDLSGNHVSSHPDGEDVDSGCSSSAYAPLLRLPALAHLDVCHCMLDSIPEQLSHVTALYMESKHWGGTAAAPVEGEEE